MSWSASLQTAGGYALSMIQLLARLLYTLSTPLRWCLHYVHQCVVFLLSPLSAVIGLGLSTASFAVDLITRYKYLYIYLACATIIGICAGCMLHGTSSLLFILLGMDTASEREKMRSKQLHQPTWTPSVASVDEDEHGRAYFDESSSSASLQRLDKKRHVTKISTDQRDLFERRWKLLRAPEQQPRRRRKGLLSQTIHEESSESDF
ncbi:hypothetical protein F4808DRAFT_227021 [Astrocystis sublimbata]|nr:hypothetical protein F4808DRAFT_227021 [Astrocystis sublimbata]